MAVFSYEASQKGERKKGFVTAVNVAEARRVLKGRRLTVVKIDEIKSSIEHSADSFKPLSRMERTLARASITSSQVIQFLRNIAAFQKAGVPILQSLHLSASQTKGFMRRIIYSIAAKLRTGGSFSKVLKSEAPFIEDITVGLIAAGEANGAIDEMCLFAADLMEEKRRIKGQLIQAMIYPALVVVAALGIGAFLMIKVIPKIIKFISNRSGKMPAITQALIDVTDFLNQYGIWILLSPVILTAVYLFLKKNKSTGPTVDYLILYIPLIGKTISASANAVWCRSLGKLLGSGISIVEAMNLVIRTMTNRHYKAQLESVRELIKEGQPLSLGTSVTTLNKFCALAPPLISVGENTGTLDKSLEEVAKFNEETMQKKISIMTKLIEPVLYVIIGGMVGFVYIAFFMGLMAASRGGS